MVVARHEFKKSNPNEWEPEPTKKRSPPRERRPLEVVEVGEEIDLEFFADDFLDRTRTKATPQTVLTGESRLIEQQGVTGRTHWRSGSAPGFNRVGDEFDRPVPH